MDAQPESLSMNAAPYNDRMTRPFALVIVAAVSVTTAYSLASPDDALLERARALHRQVPLIDGHNDFPWALREKSAGRDLSVLDLRVSAAVDHDRHPAAARGRRRRAVLVGVRARVLSGPEGGDGDARANRRRPSNGRRISRHLRARADGRRRRAGIQERPDRVADRHGRRPLDRLVDRDAADDVRAGRALHDADAQPQHAVGRFGHRHAGATAG